MRLAKRGALLVVLAAVGATTWWARSAPAQMMPGAEPAAAAQKGADEHEAGRASGGAAAPSRPKSVAEKRDALARLLEDEEPGLFRGLYLRLFSEYSPYRGLALAVATLLVLILLRRYTTRLLRQYAHPRVQKPENLERFLKTWNGVWKLVIAVFVLVALSGSLKLLGLSAAFLGMMLGWSLQAPVTGLAAWLMIILKRPFRIGDRIIIAGIIGDVSDITLTHIILNQVGGTIGGEEPSGRAVLIPNAILFGQVIMNYTLREEYMLDEVPVRLTFDSDWELAKSIMLEAARKGAAEIIEKTGQGPFIRCEFFDAGVLARLRYQSIPDRRQELSTAITEGVMEGFRRHYPRVKFCYPHSVVQYRWQEE
ncbi:MAG: hypothetical protein AMK73_07870 [Planctomycetes bacterium SM23_32]|nr:MAG: hypothetical protein AMK73_07870 [Planctomycetes bacterium SM23_32]